MKLFDQPVCFGGVIDVNGKVANSIKECRKDSAVVLARTLQLRRE